MRKLQTMSKRLVQIKQVNKLNMLKFDLFYFLRLTNLYVNKRVISNFENEKPVIANL